MTFMQTSFRKAFLAFLPCSLLITALLAGPAGAQTVAKGKLTVAVSSVSFAWLPYYVAVGAGYLADEGIEVENVAIGTNTAPIAALLGNSVDMAAVGVQAALAAVDKRQPIKLLGPLTSEFTSVMFARKEVLDRLKVSRASPIKDRVAALKGLRIAVCNPGCSTDLFLRHILAIYAPEINPERDITIVPILEASNVLASMSRGLIDVSMFSPPVPQKAVADGYGAVYIDTIEGDVPSTKGMLFTALMATEDGIKRKPTEFKGVVRALDRALKLIHSDVEAAGKAARQFMPTIEESLWSASMRQMVSATPKDASISVEGLKRYGDLINSGATKYNVDYGSMAATALIEEALKERKK